MVKVYRTETVVSVAEVEALSDQQALKVARATEGLQSMPQYQEIERRSVRLSLSIERAPRAPKGDEANPQPTEGQTALPDEEPAPVREQSNKTKSLFRK